MERILLSKSIVNRLLKHEKLKKISHHSPSKLARKASPIICEGVKEFILKSKNPISVVEKIGLSEEYFKYGRNRLNSFGYWSDLTTSQSINSIEGFLELLHKDETFVFPWISYKTLERLFEANSKKISKSRAYVLLAFLGIEFESWDQELVGVRPNPIVRQIKTPAWLVGSYQFYNREIIKPKGVLFQRAQLIIEEETQMFIYQSQTRDSLTQCSVDVVAGIHNSSICLIIRGERFEISVYLNSKNVIYSENADIGTVIFAHYVYQDTNPDQLHSSVLVLKKVKSETDLLTPARIFKNVPAVIKQFLLETAMNSPLPLDLLNKGYDASNRAKAFNFLKQFVGVYYLYCNKRSNYNDPDTAELDLSDNKFTSWLGRDLLKIYEGDLPNQLLCSYKSYNQTNPHLGKVTIDEKSSNFLVCTFEASASGRGKYINLIFSADVDSNLLLGSFNTTYAKSPPISCGLAILSKIKENEFEDLSPAIINPWKNQVRLKKVEPEEQTVPLQGNEEKIINYLSLNEKARLNPAGDHRIINRTPICEFAGVYKVYSYARYDPKGEYKRDNKDHQSRSKKYKAILIGALKITKYGYAEHRGDNDRENANGFVEVIQDNLFLKLVNKGRGGRTGTFFFHVKDRYPTSYSRRIYCGVFSGVSINSRNAIGNRIILEHCPNIAFDQIEPKRINIYHPNIDEFVDSNIKDALIGRWQNFINFNERGGIFSIEELEGANRSLRDRINLGKKFYYSACYLLFSLGEFEEGIKDFQRAIEHGYGSYRSFEEKVKIEGGEKLFNRLINSDSYNNLKKHYSILD